MKGAFCKDKEPLQNTLIMKKTKAFFKKWHEYSPWFTIVMALITPFVILLHILSINITAVADLVNGKLSLPVRFVISKLTGSFPLSIAELLIITSPLLLAFLIFLAIRFARKDDPKPSRYYLSTLVGVLLTAYFLFVFTVGTSYFTTTVDKNLGLEKSKVSKEELLETALIVRAEAEKYLDKIEFEEIVPEKEGGNTSGSSIIPYSYRELNEKLNKAYKSLKDELYFINSMSTNTKPVLLSEPMTYTHLSGVYSYFTGEANLNVNFPDYSLPFTMAHEMAHQRGVGREDEANFIAFLVCISSDDYYIKYSGYTQMFEYLVNAIASADSKLLADAYSSADKRLVGEISAYNRFFEKYADNKAANISGAINDAYQQIQGVEAGIKSYGLVVDLAVAYYKADSEP